MKKIVCLLLMMLLTFSLASCFLFTPDGPGTDDPNKDPGDEKEISESENIINVYLIAGQSNAVGYGMDTGKVIANSDHRFTEGFENVLYYGSQERWNGSYPNKNFAPVKLGMGVAHDRSGAEIGIASALADNGEMNAIIKCAVGATHLYPDTQYEVSIKQGTWTSPSYIENNNVDLSENEMIGYMYSRFEQTVNDGLRLLIEDGYTPVIKGVWWMQGEAEMFTLEMASEYRELYKTLILDMRNTLSEITGYDCSEVPFICGLPKWNTKNSPPPAYQGMVRTAMKTVAGELTNVGYVDCMPLTQHDDWHFDAAGQKYLGEQFISCLEEIESSEIFEEKISIDNEIKLLTAERSLEFKAGLTNYSSKNNYEYGFIIVPTSILTENKIKGQYIEKLDGIEYMNIPCEVTVEKIDEDYSDIYFGAKLSGIKYENINTSYTAIAYIKNEYGDYLYSSSHLSASLAEIASERMYEEKEGRDELLKIVNEGINSLAGLPEGSTDAAFDIMAEDRVVIRFSEAKSVHQLSVSNSVGADYFVKYTSSDPSVASVDEKGLITAHKLGEAEILVECAGRSKSVSLLVESVSVGGIELDGIISDGEYEGELVSASNGSLSADFSGMIKDGILYLGFTLTHGEWSPLNNSWWLNDNIEFKLDNGISYTVIFYEGVPEYSANITYGMSKTVEVDGKLVTTTELCVENVESVHQLKVGMNGTNFGWLGAIWNDNYNLGFISEDGIVIKKPIDIGNGIVLDGSFDEDVYTEAVKNNSIFANANGADVTIIGTLTDGGVLYGVTVDHTLAPELSTNGSNDWWTYMGIEFHFDTIDTQFMFLANNHTSIGRMFGYCTSVETDGGYRSTFEIFIPYESIGVSKGVKSLSFTASGWFENGWCWMLNNSWSPSHTVTSNGIAELTE